MKVSIRPAPHSKTCAISDRKKACGKFNDHSERCETECPAGYCCEMKHCWEVGEKLRDILVARGHEVKMADKKYRKGSTDSKASDNTKKAINELMAWGPDVHVAIHTNASSDPSAHGVRIGYPQKRYGSVQSRLDSSKRLADCVVAENKKIYWKPGWVSSTDGYNFTELNVPKCPAIYIEGCFANSNEKDARWWHENMDIIAKSYADGLEIWWENEGNSLPDPSKPVVPEKEKEEQAVIAYAKVKPKYTYKLNLWSDTKKTKSLAVIDNKNGILEILSEKDIDDFYYCRYENKNGYVDKRYIVFIETEAEKKEEEAKPLYQAKVKKGYIWKLSLWSDNEKTKALDVIDNKNGVLDVYKEKDQKGFAYCLYNGQYGYVDAKYIKKI